MATDKTSGSFWEHIDILRGMIVKTTVVWVVAGVIAFMFKDELFAFVLAPKNGNFITYRALEAICCKFGVAIPDLPDINLINTGLARQLVIHMKTAFCAGALFVAPYALVNIFRFVSPGLYNHERKIATRIMTSGYAMFIIGAALGYYIIFPVTVRFLGTYQVDTEVTNMITLESYMSCFVMICIFMGVICELPVITWILAKTGLISSSLMTTYRKHAVVIILLVTAIITPTTDIFTLLLVSLPICILYEASVIIAKRVEAKPLPAIN